MGQVSMDVVMSMADVRLFTLGAAFRRVECQATTREILGGRGRGDSSRTSISLHVRVPPGPEGVVARPPPPVMREDEQIGGSKDE
jgi:hypothetical protein